MTGKAFHSDQLGIRKNLLINGDMSVAQRSPAINSAVGAVDWTYQIVDRWKTLQKAGSVWTVYTHSSVPVGSSSRSMLFNTVAGNAVKGGAIQIIENVHVWGALGRRLSLQFQLLTTAEITDVRAAVLGWTGVANAVTNPISAWNGAGVNPTLAASWTYLNTPSALTGGTWAAIKKIENISVPTNVTNLAVMFWSEDETQAIGQSWGITDVQLEVGTKCTQFERLFYHDTLRLCQRYYVKYMLGDTVPGTAGLALYLQHSETPALTGTRVRDWLPYPVPMRTSPTIRHWDNAGNLGKVATISTDTIVNNVVPGISPVITGHISGALYQSSQGPLMLQYDASAEL